MGPGGKTETARDVLEAGPPGYWPRGSFTKATYRQRVTHFTETLDFLPRRTRTG